MTLEDYAAEQEAAEIARLRDDLRLANARAAAAEKRMHAAERLRESVFGLTRPAIDTPEWVVERTHASDAPHVPVLVTSDFQWGEVIDRDNMDGINEFNVEIAERRYRRLIEKTLDISLNHLPRNKYNGLVYLRLGDAVSGDIHEELRETNELGAVPAVRSLVAAESWGLEKLAGAFGQVHVVSVPGNHGRAAQKPPTKQIAENNYDTLSAWWLEDRFRQDSRMSWLTPMSTDALVDIHGRLILATHGDSMGVGGGKGFIGPAAPIIRGMKSTMEEYAGRGTPVYRVVCGHFHVALDVGYGWSNGSLPGYSEYARKHRMKPEPPCQWLVFMHSRYGPTSQWRVMVAPEALPSAVATKVA